MSDKKFVEFIAFETIGIQPVCPIVIDEIKDEKPLCPWCGSQLRIEDVNNDECLITCCNRFCPTNGKPFCRETIQSWLEHNHFKDVIDAYKKRENWLIQAVSGELDGEEYDRVEKLAYECYPQP